MKTRGLLPLFAILALSTPTLGADWVVSRVSQPSRVTLDRKTWTALKPGMTVPNQSWISTGPRGRVVLQREKDQVTFQPGTLAGVFERAGVAIHTDFAQQTGTLSLSIDPQTKPHLAVQTPYLAAVVKGTIFSVTVSSTGAAVGVDRGRVEVTDARTGEKTGVKAGQKASVDQDPSTPMSVTGINTDFEAVVHVPPFAPAVPARATVDTATVSSTTAESQDGAAAASADAGEAAQGPDHALGHDKNSDGGGKAGNHGRAEGHDGGAGHGGESGRHGKDAGDHGKAGPGKNGGPKNRHDGGGSEDEHGDGDGKSKNEDGKSGKGKSEKGGKSKGHDD